MQLLDKIQKAVDAIVEIVGIAHGFDTGSITPDNLESNLVTVVKAIEISRINIPEDMMTPCFMAEFEKVLKIREKIESKR